MVLERLINSDELIAALLVLLLTPVVQILWLSGAAAYQRFVEWRGRRTERCTITLGPLPTIGPDPPQNLRVHCLIIRYGSDAYLEQIASDQERFEGRLRLDVETFELPLHRERDTCTYKGEIRLKVHRRLGTQFKLYLEVKDDRTADQWAQALARLPDIHEVSISRYGPSPKVWFLLNQFHIVTSTDGIHREGEPAIKNNFYFPI